MFLPLPGCCAGSTTVVHGIELVTFVGLAAEVAAVGREAEDE